MFTPRRMVDQMLDLVRAELETGPNFVDKTFFEPAAGDGNFLVAILQRKLRAIKRRYQSEFWPTESLFALASIYGVELLEDNHHAAHEALLAEFVAFHESGGATAATTRTCTAQPLPAASERGARQHTDRSRCVRRADPVLVVAPCAQHPRHGAPRAIFPGLAARGGRLRLRPTRCMHPAASTTSTRR